MEKLNDNPDVFVMLYNKTNAEFLINPTAATCEDADCVSCNVGIKSNHILTRLPAPYLEHPAADGQPEPAAPPAVRPPQHHDLPAAAGEPEPLHHPGEPAHPLPQLPDLPRAAAVPAGRGPEHECGDPDTGRHAAALAHHTRPRYLPTGRHPAAQPAERGHHQRECRSRPGCGPSPTTCCERLRRGCPPACGTAWAWPSPGSTPPPPHPAELRHGTWPARAAAAATAATATAATACAAAAAAAW